MYELLTKKMLLRPCPICNCDEGKVLHTQYFSIITGFPLPEAYDVVSCLNCGFIYADTIARQKDYDLYYKTFSKYEDSVIFSNRSAPSYDKARIKNVAFTISKFVSDKNALIIDVGCANGELLSSLKSFGYNNLLGLDPSPACIEHNKKVYDIEVLSVVSFQ